MHLSRFIAIIGGLALCLAAEGSERVELVSDDGGRAVADAYGARLVSWRPAGGEEVFAMALIRDKWRAGEQVHGGLPVYWPWFVFEGPEGCKIHGVTSYAEWRVKERTANRVVFALDDDETTHRAWPHRFHAELEYALGSSLSATFRVTNTDTNSYACTEGFHPYFRVGDVRECTVSGTDGARYFCKAEAEHGDARVWSGDFPCRLPHEKGAGFVIEEPSAKGRHPHILADPVLNRKIEVAYEGNIKIVVWNSGPDFSPFGGADDPDYGLRFVCVEGATLYRDRAYTLKPGETHTLKLAIQIADQGENETCGFAELLPVEIYEKGGGDVDRSSRYSIAELVRDTGVETADFKLFRRLVKVTNTSDETRTFQAVVRAASDFKPTNWVIPGVIYGDCTFGNQASPSGLERDGEPWVFGYDRESIPSCTLSETKDALFAMFASDRDRASLESACSLKRLSDGRLEHRIFYPVRESPVCYAFKFSYVDRYDEWITLPPGATFEAESYFMTGRPRWENCGYREAFKAAMAVLKHDHPIPAMDAATAEKVSHQWILDCCEKNVEEGKSKGAMGTDISFRLGYTARTNKRFFPPWMTEAEKKLTLADLEKDPSLNRHWLRTYWMDEMGFAGQSFMTHRFAYKGAVARGDMEFAKWVLDDLDAWVKLQKESGLVYTRRRQKKSDHLSVTELGWGLGEISKIWKMLKDGGVDHPLYLDFAKKLADFFVAHYDESDPFGRIWSLKTGEKLEGGGDGGGFMVKGMLELHEVCGERRYLDCAKKAFDRYFEMDLAKFRCVAGADDCNCVDKESSFPYIYSALELYRQTGDGHYLDCAERVAAYFCSWMFTYDALYPETSEFGRFGYHTSGGTLVSCEHPAIDPYATVAIPDLFDLADLTGEKAWREAGRLIWVNAMQDVAGPDGGSMNGVLRTPGSQCEAHSQTRWAKYRSDPVAARGNFNNQCTAFIVTFRLYALDRVGDPMKGR